MSDKIHPLDAIRALEESSALKACIEALEREVKIARQRAIDNGKWLGELLAVIHRDGGHYQALHGDEKSVEDAIAKVQAAEADKARLSEALRPFALISSEGVVKAAQGHVTITTSAEYFHRACAALSGSGSGWRMMDTLPVSGLVIAGSYNAKGRWLCEVAHVDFVREHLAKIASGVFNDSPHLAWAYTHWTHLPAAPQQGDE